jgi:hypothetical protein
MTADSKAAAVASGGKRRDDAGQARDDAGQSNAWSAFRKHSISWIGGA